MGSLNIPSPVGVSALARYAELLAAFGPDSPEALQFFNEYRHLDGFEENAKQLYQLEKEDYEERTAFQDRKAGG